LGVSWDRTVISWLRSSRTPETAVDKTPAMFVMQITPLVWSALFFAFQLSWITTTSFYRTEGVLFFLLTIFGSSAAVFFSMSLLQVYNWRRAQSRILNDYRTTAMEAYPWFKFFTIAVIVLVAVEFISLAFRFFDYFAGTRGFSRSTEEFCAMTLFLVATGYLPLWCLAITTEFLSVESLWTKRVAELRLQDQ
jgi:hypothetical protein